MILALQREIRRVRARQRVGAGTFCFECGEGRPEPLDIRGETVTCDRCERIRIGCSVTELHHPTGRANDPFTIAVDVNDHKVLSAMQQDWPIGVLRNVTGDPLIKVSAKVRGLRDTSVYVPPDSLVRFIRDSMADTPERLEALSRELKTRLGPGWWK